MRTFNFLQRILAVLGMVMMFSVSGLSAEFSVSNAESVLEGDNAYMEFNVTLTAISAQNKCTNGVNYSVIFGTTTGGTADSGDFTSISNKVISYNSPSNQNTGICYSEVVRIEINNDTQVNGDRTVAVLIENPNNATISTGRDSAAGTIIDDDAVLTISVNDASIAEKDTTVNVNVLLTQPSPVGGIEISYYTLPSSPLSAISPDDYSGIATPLSITILEGAISYPIEIPIYDDNLLEGTETFQIKITTTSGKVITKDTAKVTIFDNDSAGGICSSYVGLITINEYQNNPNYFDITHNKIKGNYIEIKYIDALVKQHINDDWNLALYSSAVVVKPWNSRDAACSDPDYEIFQFEQGTESSAMGAKAIVVLTDQNGNEVDLFNLNDAGTYAQECHSFAYDTNLTNTIAADKEFFRDPDGTGDWSSLGLGANSVGSRCLNIPGSDFELIYKQFEAIDDDESLPTIVTGAADVPLKTKIANKPFAVKILSMDTSTTGEIGQLKDINSTLKVYFANATGGSLLDPTGHLVTFSNQSFTTLSNLSFPKAVKTAKFWFEYCQDSLGVLHDWDTCFQTINVPWQRHAYSRNTFSVRPDRFDIASSASGMPNLLRSGQDYNATIHAYQDVLDVDTPDYNVTSAATVLTVTTTKFNYNDVNATLSMTGETTLAAANFDMSNGVSKYGAVAGNEVAGFTFSDVGKINIRLEDRIWSAVDNDDTPMNCNSNGTYICGELNVTFIPHHFGVNNIHLRNHRDGNSTYLSNDLNMSAHIDVNISAMNADNEITQNFQQANLYYENPVSVDINVTEWNATAPSTRHPKGNLVHKHDIPTEEWLGFGGSDASGTHLIPWNETNTTQQLMFNYTRENDQTVNPFTVNGTDINITVQSTYDDPDSSPTSAVIVGSGIADRNATFHFARAKVVKDDDFYDNITTPTRLTPIKVIVYCDLFVGCSEFGIDTINGLTHDNYWWLSWNHNINTQDGNVTLISPPSILSGGAGNSPTVTTDVNIISEGKDESILVTRGGDNNLPMTVGINLDTSTPTTTSSWLVYNPTSPTYDPIPFYRVRFIGTTSNWTGYGKTGYVVDSNSSRKKNKRLGW